jgi:ribosomal subunit interface protein
VRRHEPTSSDEEKRVDVVVTSRHFEVSERFREHVEDKLSRLEKYDQRIIRVDVLVIQEANPRVSDQAIRVEITMRGKGPVRRAEAAAEDKMTALDRAVAKLATQERKAADRRRDHRAVRGPGTIAAALEPDLAPPSLTEVAPAPEPDGVGDVSLQREGSDTVVGDGPLVVREKAHPASPMSLDQALYEMELVGHDFYLFVDEATSQPSVVYRRRGYDYGVIRLSD